MKQTDKTVKAEDTYTYMERDGAYFRRDNSLAGGAGYPVNDVWNRRERTWKPYMGDRVRAALESDIVTKEEAEDYKARFSEATEFANAAHGDQKYNGKPYILHPLGVAARLTDLTDKLVAVLHDTIEDTSVTHAQIKDKFGETIADAVQALSRDKNKETYSQFIERAAKNPIAKRVKIADLTENLSHTATLRPDSKVKYTAALAALTRSTPKSDELSR